ncbi:MAG: hypothetical protein HZB20_05545 [Chloroflexi bacterium]|nr:hypothetical protein [Chloroflexota bacterium]
MQVQFLYTDGCPYNGLARSALSEVMAEEGIRAYVEEVYIRTEEDAQRLGFPGSPTILINGLDVGGGGLPGLGCRAYETAAGRKQGWPDKDTIRWALELAESPFGACCC